MFRRLNAVRRLNIRGAMLVGFSVILALWLALGYDFTRRLAEVEGRAGAINARSSEAERVLSAVQTEVLLASVYLRDAIFEPGPGVGDLDRTRLEDSQRTVEGALRDYAPLLDSPVEAEAFKALSQEVEQFWSVVPQVLSAHRSGSSEEARRLLRRYVIPRREGIVRILAQIHTLNRSAFDQQQADAAQVYRAMHRRVWTGLGFALAVSLGVALLATLYAGRLERQIVAQRQRETQFARDLQRLSARLVQAQEDERRTMARELHDEVGQALTAVKLELVLASRSCASAGHVSAPLAEAESLADRTLQSVRDLSQLLHPALLDDLGLPDALEWQLSSFSKRTGVNAELLKDGIAERLSPEVETCAFRIVQEALTNVAKHAQASSCRVYLQRLPTTVLVTIEDDGKGFVPAAVERRQGLGLLGAQERVAALQGTFRLESAPGKGTRLTVELPALPTPIPGEARPAEQISGPSS